jgi:hypothetical protein
MISISILFEKWYRPSFSQPFLKRVPTKQQIQRHGLIGLIYLLLNHIKGAG